ncbi:MAG: ABC-type transport auxiliary lipoprotein family protein [Pseudomonadota bacterium]
MPQILKALLLIPGLTLVSCGGADPLLVSIPDTAAPDGVRISYASVELRDVSLPSYASGQDIYIRTGDGTLARQAPVLWADDPEREIALQLSRDLSRITGAQVAAAPWPLSDFPQAQVEVRVADFVAEAGVFRIRGQYFVASDIGAERSELFDLTHPIPPESGARGLAIARAGAVAQLAQMIATRGLR